MELHELIKILHNGTSGHYPFFWSIIGKNIIISNGKIGTTTLRRYSEFTSDDLSINLDYLLKFIHTKNFKIHILIREPHSRFKSGILQELLTINLIHSKDEIDELMIDISNIENWDETEWIRNLENFINYKIFKLDFINYKIDKLHKNDFNCDKSNYFYKESTPIIYNYHFGNWLNIVINLLQIIPTDKIKIWEYTDLNKLLSYLDCNTQENIKLNASEDKSVIKEYLNAYTQLSNNLKKRINNYLYNEVEIWNKIIELNNKHISIFDKSPEEIKEKETKNEKVKHKKLI